MRVLLCALAACGFPQPDNVAIDAVASGDVALPDAPPVQPGKALTNFRVLQAVNGLLAHDLKVVQTDSHIDLYAFQPPMMLIPSFDTDGVKVEANGVVQTSGVTTVPLTGTVTYIVTGADDTTAIYTVTMHASRWSRFTSQLDKSNTAPVGIAVGDLDGDGVPDVVVGDKTQNLFIYRGTIGAGLPTYTKVLGISTSFVPQAITIADLDGDGRKDIAIGGFAGSSVAVYLGGGSFGFSAPMQLTALNQTTSLIASKLTGGALPDLLTTTGSGNGVALLTNKTTVAGSVGFAAAKGYGSTTTDQNTVSLAVLDWDDDGKLDLAIAAANGGIVRVLSGASGFSATGSVALSQISIPSWLATGDVDGDGKLDLAIATAGASTILVAPHGNLNAATKAATKGKPNCVGIADLDGDNRGDLIATSLENDSSGYVETTISGGTGSFTSADVDSLNGAPIGCAVLDLDGTGSPDVITATNLAIQGSVLLR